MEAIDIENSHNPRKESSETREKSFDVYVSFRGPDTRFFVDMLYHSFQQDGIRVFGDEEDLPMGNNMGQSLNQAIRHSKIAIPILSDNYPRSKWCLQELAQIVKYHKMMSQIIVPFFLNITPSIVKNRSDSYGKAIAKHRQSGVDIKTLQEWEEALIHVGSIPGLEIDSSHPDSSIIEALVSTVLRKLNRNFIGIKDHVERVMELLNVESSDVLVVGIYGIEGTGKTTIAKIIYNRIYHLFDGCSFLERVGLNGEKQGSLQSQLISNLLRTRDKQINCVDYDINNIRNRFFNKKVLIVLDDIGPSFEHIPILGSLDWLGSGSRIIITTRAEQALDKLEVFLKYEVGGMQRDEALKLFRVHAFGGKPAPDGDFTTLSEKIVSTIDPRPLTIVVFGSYLHSKSKDVWEKILDELEKASKLQDQQNLMIVIDALTDVQR